MRGDRWVRLLLICLCSLLAIAGYGNLGDHGKLPSLQPVQNCRPVKHLLGETCIPRRPKRIVVLHDSTLLDPLLVLGLKPIAVATYNNTDDGKPLLRGIPASLTQDLGFVGTPSQPNLETILHLKPDLIIGREFQKSFYGLLSGIAPTVIIEWKSNLSFKANFYHLATLLDQSQLAQQAIDRYDLRIQKFRQVMGADLLKITVSLLTIQDAALKTFGYQTTIGQVLQDAGIQRSPSQRQTAIIDRFSLEEVMNHDADVIFLVHESGSQVSQYLRSPLWQKLAAVKAGRVYQVQQENWVVMGPLGANLILDDLFKYLVDRN